MPSDDWRPPHAPDRPEPPRDRQSAQRELILGALWPDELQSAETIGRVTCLSVRAVRSVLEDLIAERRAVCEGGLFRRRRPDEVR